MTFILFRARRSTRLILASVAIASLISHAEANCHGWTCGGSSLVPRRYRYGRNRDPFHLASDIFSMPIMFNSLLRQQDAEVARMQRAAPRYELSRTDEGVILSLDVPGIHPDDLSVQLEEHGTLLRIKGERHYEVRGAATHSKFDQTFHIDDKSVDIDNVQVTLSNGVLRIFAPKKLEERDEDSSIRKIPIISPKESATRTQIEPTTTEKEFSSSVKADESLAGTKDDSEDLTIIEDD